MPKMHGLSQTAAAACTAPKHWPHQRDAGDSIAFVNVSGKKERTEIVIKDRYWNFWVFDNAPEAALDGPGACWATIPIPFADRPRRPRPDRHRLRALGRHRQAALEPRQRAEGPRRRHRRRQLQRRPEGEPRAYYSGSDEGFVHRRPSRRRCVKHVRIGHAQTACDRQVPPRPARPAIRHASTSGRTRASSRCSTPTATILQQGEPIHSGSPMLPVNWRGDGQEFLLLSGNSAKAA